MIKDLWATILNALETFKLSDLSCTSILIRKSHLSLVRFLNPLPSLPNTKTDFFSNLVLVTAGYRSFRYKRIDGTGADELKTKVHAYGPFIGVSFVL